MRDDLFQSVTDRIVGALEAGVAPWVQPWRIGIDTLPMNAGTRRPYRGVNVVLLALQAQTRGYPLQRWITYLQALELGGQVRKGEMGTTVVFWKLRKVNATVDVNPDENEADLHERVIPLLRAFTVFNVAQVDNLPDAITATAHPAWEPEGRAEELLLMSGASIRHGGALAYYQPRTDEIHLPLRHAFPAADSYYATALHELTHWTSHASRCNRQLGKRFRDDSYAVEEILTSPQYRLQSGL